ncbi:hypothetical protein RI367_001843 [Sorochytrium milnesiophthora]
MAFAFPPQAGGTIQSTAEFISRAQSAQALYVFCGQLYSLDLRECKTFFIAHAPDYRSSYGLSNFCIIGETTVCYYQCPRVEHESGYLGSQIVHTLLNAWIKSARGGQLTDLYNVPENAFRQIMKHQGRDVQRSPIFGFIDEISWLADMSVPCVRVGVLVDPALDHDERALVGDILGSNRLKFDAIKTAKRETDPEQFARLLTDRTDSTMLMRRLTDAVQKERKFVQDLEHIAELKKHIVSRRRKAEKEMPDILRICDAAESLRVVHSKHFAKLANLSLAEDQIVEQSLLVFCTVHETLIDARLKWEDWFMYEYSKLFKTARAASATASAAIQEWEDSDAAPRASASELIGSIFQKLMQYDLMMKTILESVGRSDVHAPSLLQTYACVHDLVDHINSEMAHFQDYGGFITTVLQNVLSGAPVKTEIFSHSNYILCGIEGYRISRKPRTPLQPRIHNASQLDQAQKPVMLILMTRFLIVINGNMMEAEKKDSERSTNMWPAKDLMNRFRKCQENGGTFEVLHVIPVAHSTICCDAGKGSLVFCLLVQRDRLMTAVLDMLGKGLLFAWKEPTAAVVASPPSPVKGPAALARQHPIASFRVISTTQDSTNDFVAKYYEALTLQSMSHRDVIGKFRVAAAIRQVQFYQVVYQMLTPLEGYTDIDASMLNVVTEQKFDHVLIVSKQGRGKRLQTDLDKVQLYSGTIGEVDMRYAPPEDFDYVPRTGAAISDPGRSSTWSSFVGAIGPFFTSMHSYILGRRSHWLQHQVAECMAAYMEGTEGQVMAPVLSPTKAESVRTGASVGGASLFGRIMKRAASPAAKELKKQASEKPPPPHVFCSHQAPELQLFGTIFSWLQKVERHQVVPSRHSSNVDELAKLMHFKKPSQRDTLEAKLGSYELKTIFMAVLKRLEEFRPLLTQEQCKNLRELWVSTSASDREMPAFRTVMQGLLYSPSPSVKELVLSAVVELCRRLQFNDPVEFCSLVFGVHGGSAKDGADSMFADSEILAWLVRQNATALGRPVSEQLASNISGMTTNTFATSVTGDGGDITSIISHDHSMDHAAIASDLRHQVGVLNAQREALHTENGQLQHQNALLNRKINELQQQLARYEKLNPLQRTDTTSSVTTIGDGSGMRRVEVNSSNE